MNEIHPTEPHLLIEGGLNLLLGKPGAGKSHLAAALAADVSRGRQPLTGEPVRPCAVLFLAGEERAETVAGRLAAADADLGRVAVLTQSSFLSGLRRLPELAKAAGGAALVVFDPLPSVLGRGAKTSSHSELAAVLAWADASGATVLATVHDGKVSRTVLLLSRAVFLATREGSRQVLAPLKHPALTRTICFSIEPPLVWEHGAENAQPLRAAGA